MRELISHRGRAAVSCRPRPRLLFRGSLLQGLRQVPQKLSAYGHHAGRAAGQLFLCATHRGGRRACGLRIFSPKVPAYDTFLTVDEMDASTLQLAKDYPDVVTVTEVGRSRWNHPIYCLKIGSGSQNALMYGTPHPNEPIGAMMPGIFQPRAGGKRGAAPGAGLHLLYHQIQRPGRHQPERGLVQGAVHHLQLPAEFLSSCLCTAGGVELPH